MWLFQQLIELGAILFIGFLLFGMLMLILPDFFPPPKAHRDLDIVMRVHRDLNMIALNRLSEPQQETSNELPTNPQADQERT